MMSEIMPETTFLEHVESVLLAPVQQITSRCKNILTSANFLSPKNIESVGAEEFAERLGWQPSGPGLIADLEQMRYF